jgi:4-hydroxy-tetrahydrodipicolinate synthase
MTFESQGVWTALATPFRADGQIDEARHRLLVELQVAGGVTGVAPCGTTGESPTLTFDEHERFVAETVRLADGRIGVMAGSGSNDTRTAINHVRNTKAAGADAALLVDCYYNDPSSLELRLHYYGRIREQAPDLPLVPYVIPGRTGCALGPEDLAVLHLEHPDAFPAVKQATGDLDRMRRDRALAGDGLAILSGDDDKTLGMIRDPEIRASGVVSVMSNLAPRALVEMVAAARGGDAARADGIAQTLAPLFRLVGCKATSVRTLPDGRAFEVTDTFKNPAPLKTMMRGLGMVEGGCRPPLGGMTAGAVAQCREALRAVHQADPTVFSPVADAFEVDIDARLADDQLWSALVDG